MSYLFPVALAIASCQIVCSFMSWGAENLGYPEVLFLFLFLVCLKRCCSWQMSWQLLLLLSLSPSLLTTHNSMRSSSLGAFSSNSCSAGRHGDDVQRAQRVWSTPKTAQSRQVAIDCLAAKRAGCCCSASLLLLTTFPLTLHVDLSIDRSRLNVPCSCSQMGTRVSFGVVAGGG